MARIAEVQELEAEPVERAAQRLAQRQPRLQPMGQRLHLLGGPGLAKVDVVGTVHPVRLAQRDLELAGQRVPAALKQGAGAQPVIGSQRGGEPVSRSRSRA